MPDGDRGCGKMEAGKGAVSGGSGLSLLRNFLNVAAGSVPPQNGT